MPYQIVEADRDTAEGRELGQAAEHKDTAAGDREPEQAVVHKGIVADNMMPRIEVGKDTVEDKRTRRVGAAEVPRQAVAGKDCVEQKDLDTFDNPYTDLHLQK